MNEAGPPKEPGVFDVEAGKKNQSQPILSTDDTKPSRKEHASTDNSVGRRLPHAGEQLQ
ncbi:MAG: hypothetical protein RIC89_19535 [Pseudomonadales bacterium]